MPVRCVPLAIKVVISHPRCPMKFAVTVRQPPKTSLSSPEASLIDKSGKTSNISPPASQRKHSVSMVGRIVSPLRKWPFQTILSTTSLSRTSPSVCATTAPTGSRPSSTSRLRLWTSRSGLAMRRATTSNMTSRPARSPSAGMGTPLSLTSMTTKPGCRTSPRGASRPLSVLMSSSRRSPTTGASSNSTSTAQPHLETSLLPSRTLSRISSGFPTSVCLQPAISASVTSIRRTIPTTSSLMAPKCVSSSISSTPALRRVSVWTS
nr:MAG: hypothetical protein [Chemarfal virus 145]